MRMSRSRQSYAVPATADQADSDGGQEERDYF
jgi:hypothetical protein